jgi:hypothetical protein
MYLDRAADVIQVDEMKAGKVADVLEREGNEVVGVTVVEEGETDQKGVRMAREWSTVDRGKRRRS